MQKVFVVKKYVIANSALQAIRKSQKQPVDDCYSDDATTKLVLEEQIKKANNIGF